MPGSNSASSPLEVAAGAAGPSAVQAFKLLSNETRLAILVALWEAYEPFEEDNSLRFSELRERVGTRDSGQFNYHLEKLEGYFVDSTEDGYELRETGLKFVQSVIAGAGIDDPTLEPTEIDMTCQLCGGSVEVIYEDGWVYNRCTDCDGFWTDSNDHPTGQLSKFSLNPAGLTSRSPDEIYAAAWVQGYQKIYAMMDGVCGTCSGPIERSLDVCTDHTAEGLCSNCGRYPQVTARFRCTVCKESGRAPLGTVAKYHPAGLAFYYEHDVALQYGFNKLDQINRRLETGKTKTEILSENPPRVRVILQIDDDEMWLDLDENLAITDVSA